MPARDQSCGGLANARYQAALSRHKRLPPIAFPFSCTSGTAFLQSGLLEPAQLLKVKILCRKKFFHLMFTEIEFVLVCRPVQNFPFALLNVHRFADAHAEQ